MTIERLLFLLGGIISLGALVAHVYVRCCLKPQEPDEDVYWEFEDQDPDYLRYTQALHVSLTAGCLGVLLLFIAVFI